MSIPTETIGDSKAGFLSLRAANGPTLVAQLGAAEPMPEMDACAARQAAKVVGVAIMCFKADAAPRTPTALLEALGRAFDQAGDTSHPPTRPT
jgi:hypothetical protein